MQKRQYLIENPSEPVLFNDFLRLIKLVLAYIIVFNRRREGEVSCVKLEQYTHKPDYNEYETDICRDSLSDTEKILVKQFNYMSTRGKRGRRVPILYSGLIKKALDTLHANRGKAGIHPDNIYLFPNSSDKFIRGGDAVRDLVNEYGPKYKFQKPHLIRSTKLRKHVSTVAQILILSGEQLLSLSNHLGHSEAVHRRFYRQQESFVEKTQIASMLGLINSGTIVKYKDKPLDQVTMDDILEHVTNEVSNEVDDDDDDVDDIDDDVTLGGGGWADGRGPKFR